MTRLTDAVLAIIQAAQREATAQIARAESAADWTAAEKLQLMEFTQALAVKARSLGTDDESGRSRM